jgi:hypothetical protein
MTCAAASRSHQLSCATSLSPSALALLSIQFNLQAPYGWAKPLVPWRLSYINHPDYRDIRQEGVLTGNRSRNKTSIYRNRNVLEWWGRLLEEGKCVCLHVCEMRLVMRHQHPTTPANWGKREGERGRGVRITLLLYSLLSIPPYAVRCILSTRVYTGFDGRMVIISRL